MVPVMSEFDEPLRTLTGYRLRRANSAAMPCVQKVLDRFGLRRSTYSSLVVIDANPGLNQGQLADSLAIERPNIVRIIDQLEAAKLVRRTRSAEDRRAYALQVTAKGSALQRQASQALADLDRVFWEGLSDEDIRSLNRSLQIIQRNAEQWEDSDVCKVSSP
jgi:DNA-binding MarR family transcriptional regulator